MHNSLNIRDILKRQNSDPLRLDRRDPHRTVMPDSTATPGGGDFQLTGRWRVVHDESPVGQAVADDLTEFLGLMGVAVGDGGGSITFATDGTLPPRSCEMSLEPDHIVVRAPDAAGVWAGLAWLEWEMRTRRGPFLPRGEFKRTARWPRQVSQGPWGGNYSVPDFSPEYLSDDAFRLYAHYGVNSMMIYGDILCYADGDILPELKNPDYEQNVATLQDAARRAAVYGVEFTYVVVGPKLRAEHPVFAAHPSTKGTGTGSIGGEYTIHCLCSSDEEVLAFYDETFTKLFTAVPVLAGLHLIIGGESFYHCRMWPHPTYRCERCGEREQEEVVASLVGRIADAAQRVRPDAYVNAWPYNTDQWDRPDAHELIRQLPPNAGYFDQIDRKHWYDKDGYRKLVWDYSVDFIGPSEQLTKRRPIARERGLKYFAKTETGIGLEVFQFAYVPAMHRLADKWQTVRDLEPDGVHQSWLFFGMFGSRAEELAFWGAYGEQPRDEFLRSIAVRDFGPDAADSVLASWREMSVAAGHIPCVTLSTYYVGPSFLGPCHPLVPEKDAQVPDVFDAALFFLQEGEETFSRARTEVRISLVMATLPETARSVHIEWEGDGDGWDIVLREYRAAAARAMTAWRFLAAAGPRARTDADRDNLAEETMLTELVYRTFEACANTVEFLHLRRDLEDGDESVVARMRDIAEAELANAERAVPIYAACPWLDIAERADGAYSKCEDMIREKCDWLRRYLGDA